MSNKMWYIFSCLGVFIDGANFASAEDIYGKIFWLFAAIVALMVSYSSVKNES